MMENWIEGNGSRAFPVRRTLNGPLGARALQVYENHRARKPLRKIWSGPEKVPPVDRWVMVLLKEPGVEHEAFRAGMGRIIGIIRKDRGANTVIVPAMYECQPERSTWTPAPIALTEILHFEEIYDENYHALREGVVLSIA